jgi:integrating conjugative element membrane protein (TIGR03745 family)
MFNFEGGCMKLLTFRKCQEKYLLFCIAMMGFVASSSFAALPAPVAPSTAPAAGDWLGLIKGYGKDAGITIGLLIGIAAFVWASWAAIAKFNEARQGKAEWGEVGLLGVAAGGVLVFDSYLLGTAAGII